MYKYMNTDLIVIDMETADAMSMKDERTKVINEPEISNIGEDVEMILTAQEVIGSASSKGNCF